MMEAENSVSATFATEACSVSLLIAQRDGANSDPDPSTITLEAGCVYVLTTPAIDYGVPIGPVGLPMITIDIIHKGNGATLTRAGTEPFRFLVVSLEGSLTMKNLIVSEVAGPAGRGGQGINIINMPVVNGRKIFLSY